MTGHCGAYNTPVNIYLACTVRGDRAAVGVLRDVADLLAREGHTVLTRHLLEEDVDSAEATLSEHEIFARDMKWLTAADVLIAEASGSSYGVGFEVGYVLGRSGGTDQRVLLLYSVARRSAVSRLIVGNDHPRCHVHAYLDASDLLPAVTRFLAHERRTVDASGTAPHAL
jgi:hypothetical protein